MSSRTIVGFFADFDQAEQARSELVEAGVGLHRIVISRGITDDGIAAEAPGQGFENQSYAGGGPADDRQSQFADEAHGAGVVVSVASEPRDWERVAEVLRRSGARRTMIRPR